MTAVFVSADWLADNREDVRIVDVRDEWEFDGIGHVPDAVNVPFDEFRSEEGEVGMLPPREEWESLLSEAGVDADTDLVAYDDTHGVFAARFLVTALLLGHEFERLHLLDGDFSSWGREHETTSDATQVAATSYESGGPADSPLVAYEELVDVLDAMEAGELDDTGEVGDTSEVRDTGKPGDADEIVLVDTREPWEFEEGHIPGAVQLDWRELVDDESRGLRPDAELREVLEAHGITPDQRVILYCNTARRISHTYLVLRHLGYDDVGFYEGSLTEWEARDGPVER